MAKALVLLQLTLLSVACFTSVSGNEAEGVAFSAQSPSPPHHSPIYPPSESPKYPKNNHHSHPHHHHHPNNKIQPPSQPPVQPPTHSPSYPLPKRSLVAVQGVVFCKPCNYSGVNTLLGATPLVGASVKLECNNSKKALVQESKTDKNGYFYIMAPKSITTFGSHKCKVFLSSSPTATCNKPTDLHNGMQGAILMPDQNLQQHPPVHAPALSPLSPHEYPYQLFTVGPFAFEPQTKCPY